jgi:hypothetical protein
MISCARRWLSREISRTNVSQYDKRKGCAGSNGDYLVNLMSYLFSSPYTNFALKILLSLGAGLAIAALL